MRITVVCNEWNLKLIREVNYSFPSNAYGHLYNQIKGEVKKVQELEGS